MFKTFTVLFLSNDFDRPCDLSRDPRTLPLPFLESDAAVAEVPPRALPESSSLSSFFFSFFSEIPDKSKCGAGCNVAVFFILEIFGGVAVRGGGEVEEGGGGGEKSKKGWEDVNVDFFDSLSTPIRSNISPLKK